MTVPFFTVTFSMAKRCQIDQEKRSRRGKKSSFIVISALYGKHTRSNRHIKQIKDVFIQFFQRRNLSSVDIESTYINNVFIFYRCECFSLCPFSQFSDETLFSFLFLDNVKIIFNWQTLLSSTSMKYIKRMKPSWDLKNILPFSE